MNKIDKYEMYVFFGALLLITLVVDFSFGTTAPEAVQPAQTVNPSPPPGYFYAEPAPLPAPTEIIRVPADPSKPMVTNVIRKQP
jgi:hypothetical protein